MQQLNAALKIYLPLDVNLNNIHRVDLRLGQSLEQRKEYLQIQDHLWMRHSEQVFLNSKFVQKKFIDPEVL